MWLGWQLLQNDKSLGAQRDLDRRQAAALAAVRSLEQSLTAAERFNEDEQEHGMVRFTVSSIGVRAQPANRILWLPVPPAMPSAATAPFAAAERIGFAKPGIVQCESISRWLARRNRVCGLARYSASRGFTAARRVGTMRWQLIAC